MLLANGTDDETEDEVEPPTVINSVILPDDDAEVFAEVTGWALFKHIDFCLMITIIGLRKTSMCTVLANDSLRMRPDVDQQYWKQSSCLVSS